MKDIRIADDSVHVIGSERALTYRPRRVTIDDGTWVAHESRGGDLNAVWATDLGDRFVEVVHLGHGPVGGELVVVVPEANTMAIGDLHTSEQPTLVGPEWPATVDLVLGLAREDTRIITSGGEITRDDLETFLQQLLEVLHG